MLTGDIQNETFTVKTSYAEISFKRDEISRITLEGGGTNIDVLTLVVGDLLSGVLQNTKVSITLQNGATVEIERDKIKEVVVYPRE